jgi:hypothetical protein
MTDLDVDHTLCQKRALYFLGALEPVVEAEFERHLARCQPCLDDGDQLGPILGGMAMLSGEEIDLLVREDAAGTAVRGEATADRVTLAS